MLGVKYKLEIDVEIDTDFNNSTRIIEICNFNSHLHQCKYESISNLLIRTYTGVIANAPTIWCIRTYTGVIANTPTIWRIRVYTGVFANTPNSYLHCNRYI